jgi:hypothetical protein
MFIKKVCAVLTLLCILSSSAALAVEHVMNDLDQTSDYAKTAVASLVEQNILQGDPQGNVHPKRTVTRAELVTILVRVLELVTVNVPQEASFKDVPTNSWAFPYVEAAFRAGIVQGVTQDRFAPDDTCTREQMAALFVRALSKAELTADTEYIDQLEDKSAISPWARKEVELALKNGLMNGTGSNTFQPHASASREQAAVVIARFLDEPANADKNLSVTFNGDVIPLSYAAIADGEHVLISQDFFERYFLNQLSGHPEDNSVYCFEFSWGYHHLGYQSFVWFKAGDSTAYRTSNYSQNPFENPAAYTDRAIPLKTAPILKSNTAYFPLEDVCGIVNAEYAYNPEAHTVTIETQETAAYPNLRYAILENLRGQSRGDAEVSGTLEQTVSGGSSGPEDQIKIGYDLFRRNNVLATHTLLKYDIQQGGTAPQNMTIEKITAPSLGVDYVESSATGASLQEEAVYLEAVSALTALNPMIQGKAVYDVKVSRLLATNYSRLPITRVGTVALHGVDATKYVMRFDQSSIEQVMDKNNYYGSNLNVIALYFNRQVSYEIVLYVVGDTLVRHEYHFRGEGLDDVSSKQYNVAMDFAVEYTNMEQQLQITLPDGRLVPAAK